MDFHDPVSSATHLFAAAWCVVIGMVLLRITRRDPPLHRLSIFAFVCSAVALYTLSGLFHGVYHPSPQTRRIWQLLDQSAIYWLIVGSNLPIAVYLLRPLTRNLLLGSMILCATIGTASLWLLPKAPHELLIGMYVGLGVISLIPLRTYYQILGLGGLWWIFLLSASYIGGAVIEGIKWPTLVPQFLGPHELLHIFDILGTWAHVTLLLRYVLPNSRQLPPVRDKLAAQDADRK